MGFIVLSKNSEQKIVSLSNISVSFRIILIKLLYLQNGK